MAQIHRSPPMSLRRRAALRMRAQGRPVRSTRQYIVPVALVLGVLVILGGFIGSVDYTHRDRVYPGVQVLTYPGTTDVSGKTQGAAAAALEPFSVRQRFRTVVLHTAGGLMMKAPAYSLGYGVDGMLTASRCYSVGRTGTVLHNIMTQLGTIAVGSQVPAVQVVNQHVLRAYLSRLAHKLYRPSHPGIAGRRLDVASMQRRLAYQLLHDSNSFAVYLPFITTRALPVHHNVVQHHPRQSKKA